MILDWGYWYCLLFFNFDYLIIFIWSIVCLNILIFCYSYRYLYLKNWMASRRSFITGSLSNRSIAFWFFKKLKYLLLIIYSNLCWLIFQWLIILCHFVLRIKEIFYWIYIYFLKTYLYFILLSINRVYNLAQSSGNNTFGFFFSQRACICSHCICFTTPSLSIWEYAYIMPILKALY